MKGLGLALWFQLPRLELLLMTDLPHDETARLREERDSLLQKDVDTWLNWVRDEAFGYRQFEDSLSFKVTKPLRWGGDFLRLVRNEGVGEALGAVANRVKHRVTRR